MPVAIVFYFLEHPLYLLLLFSVMMLIIEINTKFPYFWPDLAYSFFLFYLPITVAREYITLYTAKYYPQLYENEWFALFFTDHLEILMYPYLPAIPICLAIGFYWIIKDAIKTRRARKMGFGQQPQSLYAGSQPAVQLVQAKKKEFKMGFHSPNEK